MLLLILIVILLVGGFGHYGYRSELYGPQAYGVIWAILLVLLILMLVRAL